MPLPKLTDIHVNAALTDLSVAYRQDNPPISDVMFPRVTVTKQSDKYFVWDKGDLWRRNARKRAPGTDFPELALRLSTDSYSAEQYATSYPIPDEHRRNQDPAVDLERTGTEHIMDTLALEKDLTFATDFMKTGVWGTDTTVAVKWDDATSNPAGDVLTARRALRRAIGGAQAGRMKIIGLMGTIVEQRLSDHPDAIDRIKYTQAATVDAVRQILAAWLGIDMLVVGDREYTTSNEAQTDTFAPVFDDDFLLLAVPAAPGKNIPAAGYTFVWDELDGGSDVYIETIRDELKRRDIVRGLCDYDQKVVASALGVFFSDCCD
jgi:hypothetical protein